MSYLRSCLYYFALGGGVCEKCSTNEIWLIDWLFPDRANPVLNLNMVLDLDEESSDVDKVR